MEEKDWSHVSEKGFVSVVCGEMIGAKKIPFGKRLFHKYESFFSLLGELKGIELLSISGDISCSCRLSLHDLDHSW